MKYKKRKLKLQKFKLVTGWNFAARKGDSIYDHVDPLFNSGGVEACSLRRTRSLAVIREETFNDLQISGVRTRRSQLIPRAKLVDRNFFQER